MLEPANGFASLVSGFLADEAIFKKTKLDFLERKRFIYELINHKKSQFNLNELNLNLD